MHPTMEEMCVSRVTWLIPFLRNRWLGNTHNTSEREGIAVLCQGKRTANFSVFKKAGTRGIGLIYIEGCCVGPAGLGAAREERAGGSLGMMLHGALRQQGALCCAETLPRLKVTPCIASEFISSRS